MSLIHQGRPMEFFKELIDEAMARQHVDSSEDSAFYLVQLLDAFARPDRLHEGLRTHSDQPLAEIFSIALCCDGARKVELLRLSGDMSLFVLGFFPDSFKNKSVDVEYYGKLGGTAYAVAADSCRSPGGAALFDELAANFPRFVDVLNEVSESCRVSDSSDPLWLYEKWLRTGSPRCAAMLREKGVHLGSGSSEVH